MQPATSDTMRKLMRLVVTDGFGKQAEVAGYYPGGKTGTAEKVGKHGYKRGFKESFNVAAFTSVFPMNAPRYAVYMMLDEPHGNKSTYGYSTAGWVAAPAAGRVIARIGADARHAAGHPGRAGDQSGAVYPAGARPAGRRRGARPADGRRAAEKAAPSGGATGADGAGHDRWRPRVPWRAIPGMRQPCLRRRWRVPPCCRVASSSLAAR